MAKLGSDWFRGVPEEEQATLAASIQSAKTILDVLVTRLTTRKNALDKTSENDYVNMAWPYLQAHRNGRQEELDYLIKLININDPV